MENNEMYEDKSSEDEAAPPPTATPAPLTPEFPVAEVPGAAGADLRTAADPALTGDFALALLKRPDLPAEVLEQLAKNVNALKSRKVKIALVSHPHTPRHVSVPLARQFYTFDLVKVA